MKYIVEWFNGEDKPHHMYKSEGDISLPEVLNLVLKTSPSPGTLRFTKVATLEEKKRSSHVTYL